MGEQIEEAVSKQWRGYLLSGMDQLMDVLYSQYSGSLLESRQESEIVREALAR